MSAKERENKKNARKLVKQEQAKKKLVAKQRVKQERATQKAAKKKPAQQKKAVSKPPKQQYGKKKTQLSEFQRLVATFSSEEQKLLREYFQQLDQHILLPKEWKLPMLHDFEQGILYHLLGLRKGGHTDGAAQRRADIFGSDEDREGQLVAGVCRGGKLAGFQQIFPVDCRHGTVVGLIPRKEKIFRLPAAADKVTKLCAIGNTVFLRVQA